MPLAKHCSENVRNAVEPPHSSLRIDVANQTERAIDSGRLEAAVQMILTDAACSDCAISVAIVDDATIHRLNRQFLEHDYPTDVLSFELSNGPHLEGEIVVSMDTAEREAADAGWSADDELLLYVVHGALHIVGQRDKSDDDAKAMRGAERSVLERLGVQVSPGDARWRAGNPPANGPEAPRP